jgi:AcrR family transcriptional regulator
MSDRKKEILHTAIEMISDEGYSSLSMRALARASDMKLGALQYHFRTWDELLRALVGYIEIEIKEAFDAQKGEGGSMSIHDIVEFMLVDSADFEVFSDKLWPQLWAMEQVEPLVSDLLEDVYAEYLDTLEKALKAVGSPSPHVEALCLMSMTEGESLFTGSGRRWQGDRTAVHETILNFIDERYGDKA